MRSFFILLLIVLVTGCSSISSLTPEEREERQRLIDQWNIPYENPWFNAP
jgi:uncharacterized protein YceK